MLPRRFSAHGRRWGVLLMPAHELGHDYISKWVIPWDEHFDPFLPARLQPVEIADMQRKTDLVYSHKLKRDVNSNTPFNSSISEDTPNP